MRLFLLFSAFLLAPPAFGGTQLEDSIRAVVRDLDSTRSRYVADSIASEELARRETTALGRVEASARRVAAAEQELRALAGQLAARTSEISRTARQLDSLTALALARRAALARRLVATYKHTRLLPLQVALTTRTIPDLYRRALFLRLVSRVDQRAVADLSAATVDLDRHRSRLLVSRIELQRLHEETLRRHRELEAARSAESALLAQIRTQRRLREQLRDEMRAASNRLAALLSELKSRPVLKQPADSALAGAKGHLPWPAAGRLQLGFGTQVNPRLRTTTNNSGIDIALDGETDIRAVASGRVSYADRFLGYGTLVIVDHGAGFYTLYGNLLSTTVQVGAGITAGAVVGRARDYLHFEIRRDGQPVNPLEWLEKQKP
uniref:M23ase beta-sheet core domain-containing protein n=1 Tax=candidate division WOR-3 bacterium TaxID=2052148 RepID=A0A7C4G9V9_UNCW3